MDVGEPLLTDPAISLRPRLGKVAAMEDHTGTEPLAGGDLDQGGRGRHDDRHRHAQEVALVGKAQRMVSGGGGDDTLRAFLFPEEK